MSNKIKEEGEAFLLENSKKAEIVTLDSGLQYEVITEGSGPKPSPTSKVTVHYVGKLLNGNMFDSSVDRGEPATFPLNQVISGWTEGLQYMSVGSKYIFYIPSDLAYGSRSMGSALPAYSTLIFEVELLEIK